MAGGVMVEKMLVFVYFLMFLLVAQAAEATRFIHLSSGFLLWTLSLHTSRRLEGDPLTQKVAMAPLYLQSMMFSVWKTGVLCNLDARHKGAFELLPASSQLQ